MAMKTFLSLINRKIFMIFLFSLFFLFQFHNIKAQVNEKDSLSLVAMYIAYYGETWTNHYGWLEDDPPVPLKDWYGVYLNDEGTRVTGLIMPDNNIKAEFPDSVTSKTFLVNFFLERLSDPIRFANLIVVLGKIFNGGLVGAPLGELHVLDLSNKTTEEPNNKISGSIPVEIDQVTYLENLNLSNNNFNGPIPEQLGNLDFLDSLNLGHNNFEGGIPDNLGNAGSLTYLNLQHNELNGVIPADLGNLSNLEFLDLRNNELSGSIPPELCDLTNLQTLSLRKNSLSGEIPGEIGNLFNLTTLNLSANQFSGEIPDAFENLTQLQQIILHENRFSGNVPSSIGTLMNLTNLRLEENQLVNLPVLNNVRWQFHCYDNLLTFEDFEKSLDMVWDPAVDKDFDPQALIGEEEEHTVQENTFFSINVPCGGEYNQYEWYKDGSVYSGPSNTDTLYFSPIQQEDQGVYYLKVTNDTVPGLEIFSHEITINVEYSCLYADSLALVAFYHATDGPHWTENTNWLVEEQPVSTWHGITLSEDGCNVTRIELLFNNLTGTIPPEIGNLNSLSHLIIDNNNLSGEIPPEIGSLQALEILKLNDNRLTGPLPNSLYDLHNLKELNLTNNLLNGTISPRLGELTNLRFLSFEANRFGGEIPHEIGDLKELRFFSIAHTPFSGTVPEEIGELSKLTFLNFYKTGLYGSLPESLTQLAKLDTFNIQLCRFSGHIPDFSSLDELSYFNAANNRFLFGDIDAASVNTGQVEFTYAPQDTVLHLEERYESRQITIIDDGFTGNVYHWYLNDVLYEEGGDVLGLTETGMYYCHVTNPAFPELTLYSDTLYIDEIMPYYDDVEPVNLVIIDGAHPPQFLMTNIELYPDNSLVVFNRWGQKVYERSSYNNDLDFSGYAEGTYYYVLNYVKPDGPKQIKSFVDVIKN
jgi:Leucine-rich repeat (LRR) protein